MNYNVEKLAKINIRKVIWLYRVLVFIILDSGTLFTSYFWNKLHAKLGTRLDYSIIFHPWANGQFEQKIQVLEDMFSTYLIDLNGYLTNFSIGIICV